MTKKEVSERLAIRGWWAAWKHRRKYGFYLLKPKSAFGRGFNACMENRPV